MRPPLLVLAIVAIVSTSLSAQTMRDAKTDDLVDAVMRASGGSNWPKVAKLSFTFNVEQNGKQLFSAHHDWNIRAGTDTVTWGGKTVTVKLSDPNHDGDAKAAFQRWTNDSYWLLAPLKLRDGGAMVSYAGPKTIDGTTYETLDVHFADVGLTPGDRYTLYIDPKTNLLARWDYMPAPGKKTTGTWEKYQQFDGLTLSTEHQFGDKHITFTEVVVNSER